MFNSYHYVSHFQGVYTTSIDAWSSYMACGLRESQDGNQIWAPSVLPVRITSVFWYLFQVHPNSLKMEDPKVLESSTFSCFCPQHSEISSLILTDCWKYLYIYILYMYFKLAVSPVLNSSKLRLVQDVRMPKIGWLDVHWAFQNGLI